jgi:hypothetical protein
MAPKEGGAMPRFKCISCDAGFYSAACLAQLSDTTCSRCGSLIEPVLDASDPGVLAERVGHLIARREVARAQARVDDERWSDDGGRVPVGL